MKTKAAVLYEFGEDMAIEDIELDEPKDKEVLLRIAAAGVCRSDLHVARGPSGVVLPTVLGHEGSAVVERVGPGVSRVKPGDRVVLSWAPACGHCFYCREGFPVQCEINAEAGATGGLWDGTSRMHSESRGRISHFASQSSYSEFAVMPETGCMPIPPEVSLEIAAIVGCAVTTGFGAALNDAHIRPGGSIAIWGIGGVGISAVLGAVQAGAARIIVVDPNPRKEAVAKSFGATDYVNPKETNDVPAAIRELTHGRGADSAIDSSGTSIGFEQGYQSIRPAGTLVAVGQARGGVHVTIPEAGQIPTYQKRIIGSYYGGGVPERDFQLIFELYLAGKLDLDAMIGKTIQLEQVNDAFRELEAGIDTRTVISFGVE